MSELPHRPRSAIQTAKALYGQAFVGVDKTSLRPAMRDFQQLTPDDRLFIQCHLLYLNLCAQERTQQLLLGLREGQENLTGAVYAIADEVTRPRLAEEWAEATGTGRLDNDGDASASELTPLGGQQIERSDSPRSERVIPESTSSAESGEMVGRQMPDEPRTGRRSSRKTPSHSAQELSQGDSKTVEGQMGEAPHVAQ